MNNMQQEIDRLYKSHYGRLVASLLRFSGQIDWETAEDIVQDAFSSALVTWTSNGLPGNPAGWVFKVCKNKALNKLQRQTSVNRLHKGNLTESIAHAAEYEFSESTFADPTLKLLFACAHPDLSPKIQVIITLKYVVNLKVEAISRIFGMTVDGVDKLLVRARQKIRSEKILLEEPAQSELKARISTVHKIIYLMFNEGYRSSWGKEMIREELCGEALMMNKLLLESNINNKETAALHALMLFNAARFKARFGTAGQLLDLEEQNRALWDDKLITLGTQFLKQARDQEVSTYHYEASIAYLHCTAKSFEQTDWAAISNLYLQLLESNPNPFVELNYAIASYYAGNKQKALRILTALQQNPFLNQYFLLNATLGKIHSLERNHDKAKKYYEIALQQTSFSAEKDYIQKKLMMVRT